jgi:hypothetical protein
MFRCLIIAILVSVQAFAATPERTIYALIACDTITELKTSSQHDIEKVKKMLSATETNASVSLNVRILKGDDLNVANVQSWFKFLRTTKNRDVILFYFSGHGFRIDPMKTPWPYLYFPSKNEQVPSKPISKELLAIGGRLVIVIFDCCNNAAPAKSLCSLAQAKGLSNALPGLRTLFLKTQGSVIAVGSSPGQSAYALKDGGLFTNSIVTSIYDQCQSLNTSWKSILKQASHLCSPIQKPYCVINTSVIKHLSRSDCKGDRKPKRHSKKTKN